MTPECPSMWYCEQPTVNGKRFLCKFIDIFEAGFSATSSSTQLNQGLLSELPRGGKKGRNISNSHKSCFCINQTGVGLLIENGNLFLQRNKR